MPVLCGTSNCDNLMMRLRVVVATGIPSVYFGIFLLLVSVVAVAAELVHSLFFKDHRMFSVYHLLLLSIIVLMVFAGCAWVLSHNQSMRKTHNRQQPINQNKKTSDFIY